MSLFFAIVTSGLWLFSHWWARCTQFSNLKSSSIHKIFEGSLNEWEENLQKTIKTNPALTIIEKSSTHLIVNEAPGLFSYGAFHHIEWKETLNGIAICFSVQPKLIISTPDLEAKTKTFSPLLKLKNVG